MNFFLTPCSLFPFPGHIISEGLNETGKGTMDDDKLLTQYARDGSEAAFGQLVARHLTLVYATCLRETGSPSQAEDAAQVVFLLLARKAGSLRAGPSLAGWLYKAARFVAKDVRKQEARRQRREQTVMQEMTHRQEPPAPEWEQRRAAAERRPFLIEDRGAGGRPAALPRRPQPGRDRRGPGPVRRRRPDARLPSGRKDAPLPDDARGRRHRPHPDRPLTSEAARPAPVQAANVITQGTLHALSVGPTANVLLLSKGVYQTMKIIKVKFAALAAVVLLLGGSAFRPSPAPSTRTRQVCRRIATLQRRCGKRPHEVLRWTETSTPITALLVQQESP